MQAWAPWLHRHHTPHASRSLPTGHDAPGAATGSSSAACPLACMRRARGQPLFNSTNAAMQWTRVRGPGRGALVGGDGHAVLVQGAAAGARRRRLLLHVQEQLVLQAGEAGRLRRGGEVAARHPSAHTSAPTTTTSGAPLHMASPWRLAEAPRLPLLPISPTWCRKTDASVCSSHLGMGAAKKARPLGSLPSGLRIRTWTTAAAASQPARSKRTAGRRRGGSRGWGGRQERVRQLLHGMSARLGSGGRPWWGKAWRARGIGQHAQKQQQQEPRGAGSVAAQVWRRGWNSPHSA